MDQAASFFQERQNRKDHGDEIFSKKNFACSLRKIKDENLKEYTELKIQQFLFEAQCEILNLFQSQDSFIPSTAPVQTPLTASLQTPQRSNLQVPYSSVCPPPQSPTYGFAYQSSQLQNEYSPVSCDS